jgi:hypothetical protein
MAVSKSLLFLTLALLAIGGSCQGQCALGKTGCMSPKPNSSVMKCAHGYCDAATDGWACCSSKGGRVTGSPDYPFMCAMKIPFASYGATPAQTSLAVIDATTGWTTGLSGPNPCIATWSSKAVYNTVCEHPVKKTVAECAAIGGLAKGVLACGYTGTCDPWQVGCMTPTTSADPMLCANGETCDAVTDGWGCCSSKGGRVTGSPNYPFMCAMKIPFPSYGATPAQTSVAVIDATTGWTTGLSGPNPCDNSAMYSTVCEFPVKATPEECNGLNGLSTGVLACAYTNADLTTCGEVKMQYKANQCCGNPSKVITME